MITRYSMLNDRWCLENTEGSDDWIIRHEVTNRIIGIFRSESRAREFERRNGSSYTERLNYAERFIAENDLGGEMTAEQLARTHKRKERFQLSQFGCI